MTPEEEQANKALVESYQAFRRTPVYADLHRHMTELRESALATAEDSDNTNNAYGYLKSAQAYKIVMSYIERMSEPQ